MGVPAPGGAIPPGRPLLVGALLVLAGLVDLLSALAATTGAPFAVATGQGVYLVDIAGWARLHGAIGAAVTLSGLAVVTGRRGTVPVALGCAAVGAVVDLLLFPYAPVRVLLVVGLYATAVRLLLRHRRAAGGGGRLSGPRRPGRSSPDPPPWSPTRSG
ncbi:DUF7144 family membrane protein [Micromonospora psammae]|uniref:DUF7144 family membrane protein n=1 Tax=Micromonospora sp. CPCC 205556 TaxID=3122398 RepID=UPI002FF0D1F7